MEQADLLRRVIDVLEDQRIVYLLVGSLASGVYGEPRLTADVDVVVELNLPQAAKLCAAFPAPEYYVSETAARQAVARGGQFNVIHPASGNKIDFREGGSEKHLRDIAGMLQVSGEEIDTAYVDAWSRELDLAAEWQTVLDRLHGPK